MVQTESAYNSEVASRLTTHEMVCEQRWKSAAEKMDVVHDRVDKLETKLDQRFDRMQTWIIGGMGTLILGMAGVIMTILLRP